jgi:HTH-type transcriptional regulator / antitoxin HigA
MLRPIRTKKDHDAALDKIYHLMQKDLKVSSDEYNELELLSILVENYEESKFPIGLPDPVEAIKFRMEQLGLDISELGGILGSKSRASEILNRRRKLSISMIRTLHRKLKIPASSLISEY